MDLLEFRDRVQAYLDNINVLVQDVDNLKDYLNSEEKFVDIDKQFEIERHTETLRDDHQEMVEIMEKQTPVVKNFDLDALLAEAKRKMEETQNTPVL